MDLNTPVQYVKGVGERRAAVLEKAGIQTASDLLRYKPFRYEDRTTFCPIAKINPESSTLIRARVLALGGRTTHRKRMPIFELLVSDDTATLPVKFFNQPYLSRVFKKGQELVLYGVPRLDGYSLGISLINPEFEILTAGGEDSIHSGRIVPVYRRIGSITPSQLRTILFRLLEKLEGTLPDALPEWVRSRHSFPLFEEALTQLHFPTLPPGRSKSEFLAELETGGTAVQHRLAYEEFFDFQRGLQVLKEHRSKESKERRLGITPGIRDIIKSILPFHPTGAQKRVLKEIVDDLCGPRVMSRLLQGDVGSGKTIVAVQALIIAVENGFQTVLMAPTEILAEQHYETLTRYLGKAGYSIALLTARVKGQERNAILQGLAAGEIQIAIGTHAVFQKRVSFHRLGFVVIDEQHRFGVRQRSELQQKGEKPDTLVMTATPIPRSLALTLYGDLDLSIIDELPPGRQPIRTVLRRDAERQTVYARMRDEIRKGRQCYIVFPLVEESEKLELRAATEMATKLQQTIFAGLEVALIHGRLSGEEKEHTMARFKRGEIDVLVSTTVIEVGIDVPNASLMVIEHANRFGLSQLHQLRGRIGRGEDKSYCVLLAEPGVSSEARERLRIMQETNDGFRIAEKDLELRGPGDFVGTKQSGIPQFRFANLVRDRAWLEQAQLDAQEWLDRALKAGPPGESFGELSEEWERRFGLFRVG